MKLNKRIKTLTLILVSILTISNITTFVQAEEIDDGEILYESVVTIDGEAAIASISNLDQTFTMTSSHRGGDRKYSGNRLQYSVTVTDVNGNSVNNAISVRLYDYNNSSPITDTQVAADGVRRTWKVSITPNRTYYFKYVRTSGANRTLKVHMQIKSYNS